MKHQWVVTIIPSLVEICWSDLGGSSSSGTPSYGWFVRDNPIEMDDLEVQMVGL